MKYNPPFDLVNHDDYRGKIPVRPQGYFVGVWEALGYPVLSPSFDHLTKDGLYDGTTGLPKSWMII